VDEVVAGVIAANLIGAGRDERSGYGDAMKGEGELEWGCAVGRLGVEGRGHGGCQVLNQSDGVSRWRSHDGAVED